MSKSLFDFLKNEYKTLYLYCISMEKLIKVHYDKLAILTAKIINEEVLRIISGEDNVNLNTINKLYESYSFSSNSEQNKKIAKRHLDIQNIAFKLLHDRNFKIPNIKKIHEMIFYLLTDFYNNNQISVYLEYNPNYDYLDDYFPAKDEYDNIFYKLNENAIYKRDLLEFIKSQEMILTKKRLNIILKDYEDVLINGNEFNKFIDEKYSFISAGDLEYISSKFFQDMINVNDFVEEFDKSELIEVVSSFKGGILYVDDLHNDKYYNVLKEAMWDVVQIDLTEFLKDNIVDAYYTDYVGNVDLTLDRYVVFRNDYGYSFKELKKTPVLDEHQVNAITYSGKKPLVVDAGPGAGKTKVIIERVLYLIKELKKPPGSILVITFTTKAADELKERFRSDTELSTDVINQMRISTIHSFCRFLLDSFDKTPHNYLDRNGEKGLFLQKHKKELNFVGQAFLYNFQMPHAYKKFDEYNTFEVDSEGLAEYIKKNAPVSQEYKDYIKRFYDENDEWMLPSQAEIDELDFSDDLYNARYLQIAESYPIYRQIMEREDVSDHEILLIKTFEFLDSTNALSDIPFKNILIDEFQDTDPIQMKIFEKLIEVCDTFTVVGDVDQSIYGFRGSYTKFFTDFANNSNYELIQLVFNYRSAYDIVEFNEALIQNERETPKKLEATNAKKNPVFHIENRDRKDQSLNIVHIIKHLKANNKIDKYGDIAILFRSRNKNLDVILDDLKRENIPYYLKDQNDLRDQDEIKAILALFWYLTHDNSPYITNKDEIRWINLFAFINNSFDSNKIFDLSHETMNIIQNIENSYRNSLFEEEFLIKKSKSDDYKSFLENKKSVLDEIFKKVEKPDLSVLTRYQLEEIGITDEHDLNFFSELNELKALINDENIKNFEKPTTLSVFYKLLNITGYSDKLLGENTYESKKALMNLALISEIIDDYEDIIGKYDIRGLYDYLIRIVKSYSCPINETEDNSDKVHLMTVHSSKGLEYPVVILSSIMEKSFPRVFDEKFQKQRYISNKPTYYTPIEYLKYKADSQEQEEKLYNQEEKRIMYVATTRAEELLILSTLPNRMVVFPTVLRPVSSKLESLKSDELDKIRKVKTKRRSKNEEMIMQISFEDIINDYLFCPLKYRIVNNLKYRNTKNNNKFINMIITKVFNIIHNPASYIKNEELNDIFSSLIRSYDLKNSKDFNTIQKIFDNIKKYWQDWGGDMEIIDCDVNLVQNFTGCDLNASIDLIIRENEDEISIVTFIISDDYIKNYLDYYMDHLNYYGSFIEKSSNYSKYTIKNIILYCILDNKKIVRQYDSNKNEFVRKILANICDNIVCENFMKHKIHCMNCEFKGLIC